MGNAMGKIVDVLSRLRSLLLNAFLRAPNSRPPTMAIGLNAALGPLRAGIQDVPALGKLFAQTYSKLALESDKQFLATPLTKLPTGLEKGKFLAIDLGGSNLRIAVIVLLGDEWKGEGKKVKVEHMESWLVPETVKAGSVEKLFEWIVDCMDTAIPHWDDEPGPLTATLTWSFPQK